MRVFLCKSEYFYNSFIITKKKHIIIWKSNKGSLSLHWIYNCNEYKFEILGVIYETVRTIIGT